MYVETVEEEYVNKRWDTLLIRRRDIFKCDHCHSTFTKGYKASHNNQSLTFCPKPRVCNKEARSTGILASRWKETKLKKYGVEYSSQVPGAAQKMLKTRIERFGSVAPIHDHAEISSRWKATMNDRFGTDYPMQSSIVKNRARDSFLERYNVTNPYSAGSEFRQTSEELSLAGQKGYRTLIKRLGDSALSKPEAGLAALLRSEFGEINQQVIVEHGGVKPWLIDFYVPSIDTYVEMDGVFWHGLDKPYDQLHLKAQKSFDRDRLRDQWFRTHGMKLVRITDIEFLAAQKKLDFSEIVSKLGGYQNRHI